MKEKLAAKPEAQPEKITLKKLLYIFIGIFVLKLFFPE